MNIKDINDIVMEIYILDNFTEESLTEKEFINGIQVKYIKVNLKMGLNKVKEYGKEYKMTSNFIMVNGKKVNHKGMEFIYGKIEIIFKVNL